MAKVQQKFFKTAGGINLDQGFSLSANCQRVFLTGAVRGPTASDFNGTEIQISGSTSDIFVSGLNHNGQQKFFKTAGRPTQVDLGTSIISDCDNAFLTGFIGGLTAIDFEGNQINVNTTTTNKLGIFVAKIDNCGNQKFFKTAGDTFVPIQISKNEKRIFVSGVLAGAGAIDFDGNMIPLKGNIDILVAGLDNCGNQKFFKTAGGTILPEAVNLIANEKGVYVTGAIGTNATDFSGNPIILKGSEDIFVAGLDNCGNQKFFKNAGTINQESIGVSITESCGQIYVTGNIANGTATDFNGQPVQTFGSGDIFVAGLDDCNGKQKFFKTAGGSFNDQGNSIVANDHGVFVTGFVIGSTVTDFSGKLVSTYGDTDIFVAGLTKCGKQKFFVTAGSANDDQGLSITANDEGVFVTGFIRGATATDFNGNPVSNLQGNTDIFVAKLDFCGRQQFFLTAGSANADQGNQIVVRDNEIYVTSFMGGTTGTDFKHQPVTTLKGNGDIFVARLDDLCGQKRSKRSTMTNAPR